MLPVHLTSYLFHHPSHAQPKETQAVSRLTKTQNFLAVSAKSFLSPCPGEG
jgi:hypothetical protein